MAAYAFDKNNRLLTVTEYADGTAGDAGETAARYAYDAAGSVVSLIQPGSAASYAYNADRQPVKAAYRFGETASMEETFTYDVLGRITGSARSGSRPEFARTAAYGYDAAGQLVSCRNGEAVETYAYDALGNRTARSLNGVQKAAYRYNALNQLVSMTEDGVDHSFGYDRCGNLTEERRGDSLIRQYVYDTAGRMVLGKNTESGEESAYAYNALQMCVGNVQKLAAGDGFRSREMQYVPDFLSGTDNELMAYEAGAGAATAGINYISDFIRQNPGYGGIDAGLLAKMAGRLVSPYGLLRDPRKGCGSFSPFAKILGYDSAKGFQYGLPRTDGLREQKKKFDFGEFVGATIFGGVVGGVTSAGFYGVGKGIEKLKDSFRTGKGRRESRFPENPNDLFPENYAGLEKELKRDGKIIYKVQAGDKTYKVEYHPKHTGDNHYDGSHYHVLKLGEVPKKGKTKPPYFRIPNLDPNTPAQGGTFAPGDLLPTKNRK